MTDWSAGLATLEYRGSSRCFLGNATPALCSLLLGQYAAYVIACL